MPKRKPSKGIYPYPHGDQPAWRLVVPAGPDPSRPGKYLTQREVFHGSLSKAEQRRAEMMTDIARKVHHEAAGATFADTLDAYIDDRRAAQKARRTIDSYEELARLWLKPACGDVPIGKLRNVDLNKAYAAMAKAGRSPARIERAHALARAACRKARDWGWITGEPFRGVTRPTAYRPEIDPPSLEQLVVLMAEIAQTDATLGVMIFVAATIGTRRGETCALRWSHVDLEAGVVKVSRSIGQVGGEVFEKDTKTHQMRRIGLAPGVVALLRAHRDAMAIRYGVEVGGDGFVFPSPQSPLEPFKPDSVTSAFRRARRRAGIPHARVHDLRHLSVTLLANQGVDKWTIIQRLGWSSAAMFDTVYGHAMPGASSGAATAIDVALAPALLALLPADEVTDVSEVTELAQGTA